MIPDKVKIGAVTYPIVFEDEVDDNPNLLGRFRSKRGDIALCRKAAENQLLDTLLHEVVHAAEWHTWKSHDQVLAQTVPPLIMRNPKINWRKGPMPDTVDVWGQVFAVQIIDVFEDADGDDEDTSHDWNGAKGQIRVRRGALQFMMGGLLATMCAIAGNMMRVSLSEEEAQRIGLCLYQVLVDNPSLWERQTKCKRAKRKGKAHE